MVRVFSSHAIISVITLHGLFVFFASSAVTGKPAVFDSNGLLKGPIVGFSAAGVLEACAHVSRPACFFFPVTYNACRTTAEAAATLEFCIEISASQEKRS